MAVRVEPPRGRPAPKESTNYPGLTPEERGAETLSSALLPAEPAPPLWIIPSSAPAAIPSVGFVGALPEGRPAEALPPEGLFDVPGLLERLWLARALEAAHRERLGDPAITHPNGPPVPESRSPLPSEHRSGAVPAGLAPRPPAPDAAPLGLPPPTPSTPPTPRILSPAAVAEARPRSWICPFCYLTNDAGAATCRGCRSGTLHL